MHKNFIIVDEWDAESFLYISSFSHNTLIIVVAHQENMNDYGGTRFQRFLLYPAILNLNHVEGSRSMMWSPRSKQRI